MVEGDLAVPWTIYGSPGGDRVVRIAPASLAPAPPMASQV